LLFGKERLMSEKQKIQTKDAFSYDQLLFCFDPFVNNYQVKQYQHIGSKYKVKISYTK
jgi:hypothetical protein